MSKKPTLTEFVDIMFEAMKETRTTDNWQIARVDYDTWEWKTPDGQYWRAITRTVGDGFITDVIDMRRT